MTCSEGNLPKQPRGSTGQHRVLAGKAGFFNPLRCQNLAKIPIPIRGYRYAQPTVIIVKPLPGLVRIQIRKTITELGIATKKSAQIREIPKSLDKFCGPLFQDETLRYAAPLATDYTPLGLEIS